MLITLKNSYRNHALVSLVWVYRDDVCDLKYVILIILNVDILYRLDHESDWS